MARILKNLTGKVDGYARFYVVDEEVQMLNMDNIILILLEEINGKIA